MSGTLYNVTVPGRKRRRVPGIRVHSPRELHPEDSTFREGIPVTSAARTLLDYAGVAPRVRLERAVEAAERLQVLDLRAINRQLEGGRGRRGTRALRVVFESWQEPRETRSELERRFLDFCRRSGLPIPQTNVLVEGFEVDACWPEKRLIVELDSFEFHGTRWAFERDRVRNVELRLAGYEIVSVTSRRLSQEPGRIYGWLKRLGV